ncbi:hypothetical protein [Streptomyces syringium]|uniref:hypothetical protein n=1 Tax=Streptomyces syringium TaxID=76729 RepID=UPI003AADBE24
MRKTTNSVGTQAGAQAGAPTGWPVATAGLFFTAFTALLLIATGAHAEEKAVPSAPPSAPPASAPLAPLRVIPSPSSSSSLLTERLAGSTAGEGRTHPGRATSSPDSPADSAAASAEPSGSPSASQPPAESPEPAREPAAAPEPPFNTPPPRARLEAAQPYVPGPAPQTYEPSAGPWDALDATGSERAEESSDPVMRVLPLGTGMTLTGLGLGFLGLRLRRG